MLLTDRKNERKAESSDFLATAHFQVGQDLLSRHKMASLIAPVSALLLSVAFLMMGHGLQTTILPIRAEMEAFSGSAIGIMSSMFFVGVVGGGLLSPYIIVRAGHIRAFAALISLGSAAALIHPLVIDTWLWSFSRMITGFCVAATYLIFESWLNERATNETRGLVMSTYTIVVYTGIMIGQLSTIWLEISGFQAFVVSSIALSIAVIPVALTKSAQPAPIALVRFRPLKLYQTSPAAIISIAFVGMTIGALFSLLPLFGSQTGMSSDLIPVLAGSLMFGGLLLQYPLGRMSDKVDRRVVLIVGGIGTVIVCLVLVYGNFEHPYALIGLTALLGGLLQPLYSIAAAHAYDYTETEDMLETAAGILLAYGIGSIFGPTLATTMMEYQGPTGLFLMVAIALSILTIFLLLRLTRRDALATEDKDDYDLASAAPIGGIIAPDLYEGDDDYVLVPDEYEPETDVDEDTTSETPYSDNEENEGTD